MKKLETKEVILNDIKEESKLIEEGKIKPKNTREFLDNELKINKNIEEVEDNELLDSMRKKTSTEDFLKN